MQIPLQLYFSFGDHLEFEERFVEVLLNGVLDGELVSSSRLNRIFVLVLKELYLFGNDLLLLIWKSIDDRALATQRLLDNQIGDRNSEDMRESLMHFPLIRLVRCNVLL